MPIHNLTLDMDKNAPIPDEVTVRVGERGTEIVSATLISGGLPYKVDAESTVRLQIQRKDGGLVRAKATRQSENVYNAEIPSMGYIEHGLARRAFFAVYGKDDEQIATSQDFRLIVLPGTTDELAVRYFDAEVNKLTSNAEKLTADAEEATRRANDAADRTDRSIESATTATENADTATKAANDAASAANTAKTNADAATKEATSAAKAANDAKAEVDEAMKTFRTISSVTVDFAPGDSASQVPAQGWAANPMQVDQGKWLWTRTTIKYNQGADSVSYSAAYQGLDGNALQQAEIDALKQKDADLQAALDSVPKFRNILGKVKEILIRTVGVDENEGVEIQFMPNTESYEFYSIAINKQGISVYRRPSDFPTSPDDRWWTIKPA